MNYHAHIYWKNDEERKLALSLRENLLDIGCQLGSVHDRAIGPHPLPMYQAMYSSKIQSKVEDYLESDAGTLTVLLHEDTGDDLKDHTEGARWIGKPVTLDIEWLKRYINEGWH